MNNQEGNLFIVLSACIEFRDGLLLICMYISIYAQKWFVFIPGNIQGNKIAISTISKKTLPKRFRVSKVPPAKWNTGLWPGRDGYRHNMSK